MTVSAAYGRVYRSMKAAKADWADGKDFIIRDYGPDDGRYVNKQDKPNGRVMLRYDHDRKIGELQR